MNDYEIIKLSGTTDGSGDATVNANRGFVGWLECIDLEISDLAATADVTCSIQSTDSGNAYNVLVQADSQTDKRYYPRTLEHLDTDGSDLSSHTRHFVNGKPRVVVAQGGDTKVFTATFIIWK